MSKKLWKAYVLMLAAFLVWAFLHSDFDVLNLIFITLAVVGLIGVFGFAFSVRIGFALIWKLVFFVFVALALLALKHDVSRLLNSFDLSVALDLSLMLIFQGTYLSALWAYAYKSSEVWKRYT